MMKVNRNFAITRLIIKVFNKTSVVRCRVQTITRNHWLAIRVVIVRLIHHSMTRYISLLTLQGLVKVHLVILILIWVSMSIHWPLSIMLILCSLWPHPLKSIRLCRIKILLLPYLILAETLLAITKIVKFLLLHIIV